MCFTNPLKVVNIGYCVWHPLPYNFKLDRVFLNELTSLAILLFTACVFISLVWSFKLPSAQRINDLAFMAVGHSLLSEHAFDTQGTPPAPYRGPYLFSSNYRHPPRSYWSGDCELHGPDSGARTSTMYHISYIFFIIPKQHTSPFCPYPFNLCDLFSSMFIFLEKTTLV